MTQERGAAAKTSAVAAEKIELEGLYSQMLGVWYPTNYIVAAIDPAEGAAALKKLHAAGFGDNAVHLHDSARIAQIRAAIREQRTPMQRTAASITRSVTDAGLMSQDYFDEAERGASLIAVLAPEPRLVTQAGKILRAHGGRHMRHYEDKRITDLA